MADSPRWCDHCKAWGNHHTDRCPGKAADAPDTRKSSAITDHPFRPRAIRSRGNDMSDGRDLERFLLPPSEWLCGHLGCNLAEAAHSETTVKW
jgi:hypothetical protein